MPRQDINMLPAYGEVNLTYNLTSKLFYDFSLIGYIEGMDNDNYCFAEITIPSEYENKFKDQSEIHTSIPYVAEFKLLKIRIRIERNNGNNEYLINRMNNTIWFSVLTKDKDPIPIPMFHTINDSHVFNLILYEGNILLYSGYDTDFIIKHSLEQTKAFLLKASAGNIYQFPQTGVGLMYYLHGNLETSNLSHKLLQEFENDNLIIKDAYMNSDTGELLLDVEEKEYG
ncbi:hypothetical protein POZ03_16805 [Bacteroides uniformis]|uniref:hypothetical protein n=1 Tax=Bacteroides uniformis TaxID=820 RepID=UPI00233E5B6B|nr:hypothetical protein [Bacteroides uniformis]MDC1812121.1 hypothetical protein [Bacteroides uniformis]